MIQLIKLIMKVYLGFMLAFAILMHFDNRPLHTQEQTRQLARQHWKK